MISTLYNKSFITTEDWSVDQLESVLEMAADLKRRFAIGEPQSVIYDEDDNRLHAQKAIMALTMGGRL
jgi:ornithine carbamoyltransferase